MTISDFFHTLFKVFSMKNDTAEDAKRRFIRSLICVPISIIPSLCMIYLPDVQMNKFTEYSLFSIFCLCLLAPFVAMSSPIAPLKAAFLFEKRLFGYAEALPLFFLFPLLIVFVIFSFVLILASTLTCPIFMTLYGVYISKKNLDRCNIGSINYDCYENADF